jgi:hypothetical protein
MKKSAHHLITEIPRSHSRSEMTIGIDLGDVWSHYKSRKAKLKEKTKTIDVDFSDLLIESPSAVSEAPQAEERDLSRWAGALRIQRLEGSRPAIGHGLWVLYGGEQVLRVGEIRVGGCVGQLLGEGAERRVAGSCFADCGEKAEELVVSQRKGHDQCSGGARRRFGVDNVDSCCTPAGMRWRSEQELSSGEALDDVHDSTTERAVPE